MWNPVKELKVLLLLFQNRQGYFKWNPVKELKGLRMFEILALLGLAAAYVESGEGIERVHQTPGQACSVPSGGIR